MRLFQNLGYLFSLFWVCFITGCSSTSKNLKPDLVTVLCKTDQSCIDNINEQTWQGEKRRKIIEEIAKKNDEGKTFPSILYLQDFSHHQIYVLNAQASWIVFHSTVYKMTKYYDLNNQQEVEFKQILDPPKVEELNNAVRKEFKNTLTNSKFLFNWQGERSEQNYEKWLNENMPQIIERGGSFKNRLSLEYCNTNYYTDRTFHVCITLPADKFLKDQ